MCEISYSPHKPAPHDQDLTDATLSWMVRADLISGPGDVVSSRIMDVPLGYPVSTHAKQAIVDEIRAYLESHAIHSIGRFGAWEYANSDECIRQGMTLAARLTGNCETQ